MERKKDRKSIVRVILALAIFLFVIGLLTIPVRAEEQGTMPSEYSDFRDSIDDEIRDKLPEGIFSDSKEEINGAAEELINPASILNMLIDALGVGLESAAPTLAIVLGIVILSAILSSFASSVGGLSRAVEGCIRLCTFTAISGIAVRCAESLSLYFERLFSAVAGFLPLSAALYAMGGNLTVAAGTGATLGITLAVVQFFCTKTVIPVFCICLCSSMLLVFEGQGGSATGSVSGMIRKWYTTSLAFVMMILTCSLGGSTLLASKADNMAMRGAKFAASSFIPVSGGTVSSTLGTLAASVELLRGSVGVIGIVIIIMMLLPTVIELALLRGVFLIGSFCASTLGAQGEAKLLGELDSLYGYLEGIAALSAVVFIIAFGIFATVATPFG
ncbi:MAG: hypothetical protein IKJ24_00670 [Clostridia bacterium]|nr:hypothetical protein [Clostridia bacterium]